MAYSDYPESGVSSGPASDYTEYPTGDAGGPSGEEPEEHFVGDDGYLNPKVQLVRRIKGVILVVEILVMLVLVYMAYDSSMADYQSLNSKPILPLGPVLFMMLFMGVMMAITGIVFRLLELRFTENPSQRVLLANSAFRSALTSMVVAIVFMLILVYVPTMSVMKDALSSKSDENKGYGDFSYKFKAQDEFLVTRVNSIRITTNYPEDMVIAKKELYENFTAEYQQYLDGQHSQSYIENYSHENKIVLLQNTTQLTLDGDAATSLQYGEYQAAVFVNGNDTAKIHYELQREIQPGLLNTLIMFLLVFAILDGCWMGAALGIRQKYKKGSIYT
jgi:uncharacterized integral membrane protein/sRNA-binding carbon storage regulator CsrA